MNLKRERDIIIIYIIIYIIIILILHRFSKTVICHLSSMNRQNCPLATRQVMTRISFGHRIRFARMPAAIRWDVWHYRVEGIAVRYAKHRYEVCKASE